MNPDDTICALATAPGPGARAVARLAGPGTRAVLARILGELPPGRGQGQVAGVGLMVEPFAHPVPADLYLWAAPRSYTGQDAAELHFVSSAPIAEAVVAALLTAGARAANPGEFTARAFLAGKKDLTQAEAVLAVVEATSAADLRAALGQLAGGVTAPLARVRSDLLDLLADTEATLDFADADIEFVSVDATLMRISTALAHLKNLNRQLGERSASGRPVRVALVGKPNAGKSTLFNAILGRDAALVSDRPGTTRDYLTAETVIGGVPVELADTAGLGTPESAIDAESQSLGRAHATRADVTLWCVPLPELVVAGTGSPPPGRVVRVATQSDRSPATIPPDWLRTSAITPDGLSELLPALTQAVTRAASPPLAPSQSRVRAHIGTANAALLRAHEHTRESDPPELLALALREALHEIGAMAGEVHTDDLLDRIFSRFCIGK